MRFLNKNLFIYLTFFIGLIYTQEVIAFTGSEINAGEKLPIIIIKIIINTDSGVLNLRLEVLPIAKAGTALSMNQTAK